MGEMPSRQLDDFQRLFTVVDGDDQHARRLGPRAFQQVKAGGVALEASGRSGASDHLVRVVIKDRCRHTQPLQHADDDGSDAAETGDDDRVALVVDVIG